LHVPALLLTLAAVLSANPTARTRLRPSAASPPQRSARCPPWRSHPARYVAFP
jgi:hypothetical protein